ncbi:GlxA family transcriptional regulator [Pseudopedobacter beijingensis]|uniref:GlxA family transcriptional regulator n=1 Tax=Pseudopedobacter beijingensis TaxID=1207056 RepID=A0ABW4IFA7_9SPHI
MNLCILLTKNYRLLSLAAIMDVFDTANSYLIQDGKTPLFCIKLMGIQESDENELHNYRHLFHTVHDQNVKPDLILVPAFGNGNMMENLAKNTPFIPWLKQHYNNGATIMSVCTGAFLLGACGLLNDRTATTHIDAIDAFSQAFPEVKLMPHAVVTQSDQIYTSGGATSSFHLKLLIIQKYGGRELALRVAKTFAIDMDRNNQLYFEYFKPELSTDDLVRSLQVIFNTRYQQLKNVEEALDEIPASRRNLLRRFKQTTGLTPIKYLQKTKIEAAKQMLSETQKDIADIMLLSGYQDIKNFRQLFKSFTGLTPKAYRNKFKLIS